MVHRTQENNTYLKNTKVTLDSSIKWKEEVPGLADHIEHTEEVLTTIMGGISLEILHRGLAAAILDFRKEEITYGKISMDIAKISPQDNSQYLLCNPKLQEGNIQIVNKSGTKTQIDISMYRPDEPNILKI